LAKNIWIGSLLLMLFFLLWAQDPDERLEVIHSDKLFLTKVQDEQVMQLNGKVHFWYGKTEFKCDRALIFDKQKIARLDGNVIVNNDSLTLQSDSLSYYRIPEDLNAGGGVYITETKQEGNFRWFRSEYAIYNKKEDNLTVWQGVSSYDSDENASATCGYAFWDRRNGYAYMTENPRVETAGEDTLFVSSQKMEFFDEDRKLVATFNVEAQSRDYRMTSDFLIYFMEEDKAVFTGQPRFSSDFATASAREFYLFLDERKLRRAEMVDSCRVEFSEERLGERRNWVRANFIKLDFEDDMIRAFEAENKVSYHYFQEETDERDFFINTADGVFLEAKFTDDNKLEYMKMRRGIKGIYKFDENS